MSPSDNHVHEIPLDQIRPAPWNPPSRMIPEKVRDLAESIRIEGQQAPALVRPIEAGPPIKYELVWGHRRYAAKQLLAAKVDAAHFSLKTFIREMTEEQAMISSGIENLQREGFSDIEEAEFFRTCSERYGESAVKILSEKLSVSDRYIRKRLKILELPEAALELWRAGTWHVGHMEQLLRLGDNDKVASFMKDLATWQVKSQDLPVWRLKDRVDQLAIPLHSGRFDKTECKACLKNTDCQLRLFGGEKEKTKCLDEACFHKKQQAWHDANWATSKANKFGTRTALIGEYDTKQTGSFSFGDSPPPAEKCLSCQHYATIIRLNGESIYSSKSQVCLGKSTCYAEVKAAGAQKKKGNQKDTKVNPDTPRVDWHGEYFRQEFYKEEIPLLMDRLDSQDPRRLRLALATFVYSTRELSTWFCQQLGVEPPKKAEWETAGYLSFPRLLELVKTQSGLQAEFLMAIALAKIALGTGYGAGRFRSEISFTDADRQALAEFLDIDWTRFQVTEGYLEKKTKAELVRFIVHDSGLWQTPEFKDGMIKLGFSTALTPEQLAATKKPRLVELILQCGVDLHGRLPKEIADRPKLQANGELR
ncbi:MAG: ParB/RepB/Spo0J family partition protein [Desulfobaccales bacterium]